MVDRRRHARLALEAFPELLIAGALGRQELERHRPPETQLGGPVDHAHAAAAGHRFDAAAGELFALFEFGHTRIVTRSPGYAGAMDLGNPASYLVLAGGTPVVTSDGHEIGSVEHVLADAGEDVFDGVIVDLRAGPGGHRFADASQVEAIYERGVVLAMSAEAAERLPAPAENPAVLDAGPDDTVPDDLKDKLRRAWDYLSGNY